jgi:hypothetical protein
LKDRLSNEWSNESPNRWYCFGLIDDSPAWFWAAARDASGSGSSNV